MSRIVSSLPGRIRVRDKALRHQTRLDRLEAELRHMDGVTSVQVNAGAGSVVLCFDAARTGMAALETAVEAAVDASLSVPLAKGQNGPSSLKRQANRYAKAGMLGSLATSLALAAAGRKRWHAVTGGVFVACLGVHLGVYRRSLLR
jgi:copper chaperone CopZ